MKLQKWIYLQKTLCRKNVLHSFEVDKKVYNHQLLSILINFTNKFCYSHRQTWKSLITCTLTKTVVLNFSEEKLPWAHLHGSATFLKLHVHRQKVYKNCISSRMFVVIFWKFSDQHFESSRTCFSFSSYEPERNRSV